jgi:hypothetical protein
MWDRWIGWSWSFGFILGYTTGWYTFGIVVFQVPQFLSPTIIKIQKYRQFRLTISVILGLKFVIMIKVTTHCS